MLIRVRVNRTELNRIVFDFSITISFWFFFFIFSDFLLKLAKIPRLNASSYYEICAGLIKPFQSEEKERETGRVKETAHSSKSNHKADFLKMQNWIGNWNWILNRQRQAGRKEGRKEGIGGGVCWQIMKFDTPCLMLFFRQVRPLSVCPPAATEPPLTCVTC